MRISHNIHEGLLFWPSTSLQIFSTQVTNSLHVCFSFLLCCDARALRVSYLSFESLHTDDVYVSFPRRPGRNLLQSTAEVNEEIVLKKKWRRHTLPPHNFFDKTKSIGNVMEIWVIDKFKLLKPTLSPALPKSHALQRP